MQLKYIFVYSSMLLCRNSVSKGNFHLQSFVIPDVLNLKSKLPTMQAARENTFNLSYPFGKLQGKFLLNCLLPTFRQSSTICILPSIRCIGAQPCFPTIYPKEDNLRFFLQLASLVMSNTSKKGSTLHPVTLRKAKIVYNLGLPECKRAIQKITRRMEISFANKGKWR